MHVPQVTEIICNISRAVNILGSAAVVDENQIVAD